MRHTKKGKKVTPVQAGHQVQKGVTWGQNGQTGPKNKTDANSMLTTYFPKEREMIKKPNR